MFCARQLRAWGERDANNWCTQWVHPFGQESLSRRKQSWSCCRKSNLWARNQPHRKSVKKGSINVKTHVEKECEFILGRLHFNWVEVFPKFGIFRIVISKVFLKNDQSSKAKSIGNIINQGWTKASPRQIPRCCLLMGSVWASYLFARLSVIWQKMLNNGSGKQYI